MSKKKLRKSSDAKSAMVEVETGKSTKMVLPTSNGFNSMTNWLIMLVLILPVIFSEKTLDPNVAVRYIYFSVLLFIMVFYFFKVKKNTFYFPAAFIIRLVFILGFSFCLWSIVSMFTAINYREGYYEVSRHLLNIIFLFFVMTATTKEETQIEKLCRVLVVVSLFQSFVGIFQFYELAFNELPGANAKPYGLMSNRNLFGSAQALILPFVIYSFYKTKKIWKIISAVAIVCIFLSILLSQTRSAWLATMAILLVSLILVLIFSPANRKKWILGFTGTLLCITVLVFITLLSDKEGSLKQSVIERTKSFTQSKNQNTESVENVQERFKIWNKTIGIIKDKPLTGAGPGNWKINILAYGSEGLTWAYGKYAPDRPHNVYLHVASETGIPGALMYFGMWLLIAIVAFKVIIKPQTEDQRILCILMLSGLAAFACDSMFSFPTERIEHSMYLILMSGIILGCYNRAAYKEDSAKILVKKSLVFFSLFILIFNFYLGVTKYNFEMHLKRAKAFEASNDFSAMLDETEAGKNSFITTGPETVITMELKSSIALKELKEYDKALKQIKIAINYSPYNANNWSTMGTIYTDLKQYDQAVICYQKALKFTPYYDVVLKNLAINYFMLNNYTGCIETLGKIDLQGDTYLTGLLNEAKRRKAEK